jgi:predicted lipoprotein with Yx(FWY)xxD motif
MPIARHWLVASGFSTLALVAAGCSSSGGTSSGAAAPGAPAGGAGQTVSVQTISGSKVLVDGSGHSLYFSDQEKAAKKVLCSSSACHAIWSPLTIAAGQQPTGPTDVMAALSSVALPGGGRQVEYEGAPLYTFSFDHSAGQLNGNGQKDSFDGTNFSWEAAAVSGAPVAAKTSSPNPYGSGGGGYGGGY